MPASRVSVEVNDLRVDRGADSATATVLRSQIENALGKSDSGPVVTKHRLLVDLIEHRSFFTLGNWNGATRLRARLITSDGRTLGPWDASGTARRSNMAGYATARAVAQDSYNAAVADLLSALNAVSLP